MPAPRGASTRPRPGPALPLSILLHVAVIYSVSRAPWLVEELQIRSPTPVVWLNDWPRPRIAAPEPLEPPQTATPAPPPALPQERAPTAAPEESLAVSDLRAEDAEAAPPTPDIAVREPTQFAPVIDWEKQRQQAAARVVEEREREEPYSTFSLDDVIEDNPRAEPTPPTNIAKAIADPCRVVTNKFQKFALQMIGRCVREARGDLFADIKPAYLRNRPVCAETRPGQAPVMDARGNEISTVKCRLVDEDEYASIATDE